MAGELESRLVLLVARIRAKFNEIASRLIPTGGTAGQILTKKSATANDFEWRLQSPSRLKDWITAQIDFINIAYNGGGFLNRTEVNLEQAYSLVSNGMGSTYSSIVGVLRFNFAASDTGTDRFTGIYHNYGATAAQVNFIIFSGPTNLRRIDTRYAFVLFGRQTQETISRCGFLNAVGSQGDPGGIWFEWNPSASVVNLKYTKRGTSGVTTIATSITANPTSNTAYTVQFIDDYNGNLDCYLNETLIAKVLFADLPVSARYANSIETVRATTSQTALGAVLQLDYIDTLWNFRLPR